ncbi:hypothetical protein OOT00_07520 [Desulfobotulus sp. H1]|uniref:Uncharacterized protein n=1 Tax=Desulfobotulus pelophilus TaxID=2823377 RepID=A0ABT3N8P4_9BACT|nr:hypothetical protein [Desulfobotulus pelophilus]MCW7753829.1 hypothetical protein [Desulfobotulus pelophilus]
MRRIIIPPHTRHSRFMNLVIGTPSMGSRLIVFHTFRRSTQRSPIPAGSGKIPEQQPAVRDILSGLRH